MYTRVSSALRDKIGKDLVAALDEEGGDFGILNFKPSEIHLLQECVEWRECINTYYLSSYRGGALKNFLKYEYIRPEKIFQDRVHFSYDLNWHMTWRDWFIVEEGVDHASIIPT